MLNARRFRVNGSGERRRTHPIVPKPLGAARSLNCPAPGSRSLPRRAVATEQAYRRNRRGKVFRPPSKLRVARQTFNLNVLKTSPRGLHARGGKSLRTQTTHIVCAGARAERFICNGARVR